MCTTFFSEKFAPATSLLGMLESCIFALPLPSLARLESPWIYLIYPQWEWPVIKVFRFPLHVTALTISRVRCFLTAGCAVTCACQAFLYLLGCLLSTLMAIGGWVQASPDHCSQSWVSGTDRRNGNHINSPRTKRKTYILSHIHSKQKQENLTVFPLHQQHVSVRLIVVY